MYIYFNLTWKSITGEFTELPKKKSAVMKVGQECAVLCCDKGEAGMCCAVLKVGPGCNSVGRVLGLAPC